MNAIDPRASLRIHGTAASAAAMERRRLGKSPRTISDSSITQLLLQYMLIYCLPCFEAHGIPYPELEKGNSKKNDTLQVKAMQLLTILDGRTTC